MTHPKSIICPICSKENTWHEANAFRPFCSHRCKLIDLGDWAREARTIPGKPVDPHHFSEDKSHDANEPD